MFIIYPTECFYFAIGVIDINELSHSSDSLKFSIYPSPFNFVMFVIYHKQEYIFIESKTYFD